MKNTIKWFGIIAFAAVIGFLTVSCSGEDSKLSGTWEIDGDSDVIIEFKGKNFNIVENCLWIATDSYSIFTKGMSGKAKLTLIENLPYQQARYHEEANGKYSISEDKIEFVFSENGSIDVYSFSQTENTITINGKRFTRKK